MSPGKDIGLGDFYVIHKLIFPHREEFKEKVDKSRDKPPKKMEPGTCLDLAAGGAGHSCVGRPCLTIQSFQ